MKKVLVALLVALGILVMPTATVAQGYNPLWTKMFEVSVPTTPLANPTGAITLALGSVNGAGVMANGSYYVFPFSPAFAPVAVSCGGLSSPYQLAVALANGIAINGAMLGYNVSIVSPGTRVLIMGPAIPGIDLRGFDLAIFHGEIDPLNGLPFFTSAAEVRNLCDGILGNEQDPSTGFGIDVRLVPVTDPQVGDFELQPGQPGQVIPANFLWDGTGQVSVEPGGFLAGPQPGMPVSGTRFLRATTAGAIKMFFATGFRYSSQNPVLSLSYYWINGEGGVSPQNNDAFTVSLGAPMHGFAAVLTEDTFTPLSAGVRSMEAFVPELFPYIQDGEEIMIQFNVGNGAGWTPNQPNDSTVYIDLVSLGVNPGGEGNSNWAAYVPIYQFSTFSWTPQQWNAGSSAADKKAHPGGLLSLQFSSNTLPFGSTAPIWFVADILPYGSNPLLNLPNEPNVVGLSPTLFVLFSGTFGWNMPSLTFFLPQTLTADGLYLQAVIADPAAPNGFGISNRIRHRVE